VLRYFVQDDRSLRFIASKELNLLHLRNHLIILICSLDVFPEECPSNASFEYQNRLWILISHLDLRIEAPLGYVHALEPSPDLFDHLRDLLEYGQVEVAVAAPLPLMEGGTAESHASLLDISTALVILRLERHLLLLLSTWIIRVDLLMLELRVEFVDPLIVDSQKHN
jgi:hypothetical protein